MNHEKVHQATLVEARRLRAELDELADMLEAAGHDGITVKEMLESLIAERDEAWRDLKFYQAQGRKLLKWNQEKEARVEELVRERDELRAEAGRRTEGP